MRTVSVYLYLMLNFLLKIMIAGLNSRTSLHCLFPFNSLYFSNTNVYRFKVNNGIYHEVDRAYKTYCGSVVRSRYQSRDKFDMSGGRGRPHENAFSAPTLNVCLVLIIWKLILQVGRRVEKQIILKSFEPIKIFFTSTTRQWISEHPIETNNLYWRTIRFHTKCS